MDLHALDDAPNQSWREATAQDLDFGKFGHAADRNGDSGIRHPEGGLDGGLGGVRDKNPSACICGPRSASFSALTFNKLHGCPWSL